jgi:lipopolysaccharide heptosyltransferase II
MKKMHVHYLITHGIGDAVMTVPVIKALTKKKFIDLSITVKSKTEAQVIDLLCPELNIQYIYYQELRKEKRLINTLFTLIKKIRKFKPDVILSQFGVTAQKSSILSFLSGVKIRIGWKGPFSFLNTYSLVPSGAHKIDENLKALKILKISYDKNDASYPTFTSKSSEFKSPLLRKKFIIHSLKILIGPGSTELEKHKRWPAIQYNSLIKKILNEYDDIQIFIAGNQEEWRMCQQITEGISDGQNVINLAGKLTIRELIFLLSRVHLTISGCTGIAHLACSTHTPIIGLYGPTNYNITGPRSDNFFPITAGLECSPCYRRGYETGCGNPLCMKQISVEKVYRKVKNILNNKNGS